MLYKNFSTYLKSFIVFIFCAVIFGLSEPHAALAVPAQPDFVVQSPALGITLFSFWVKNNGASTSSPFLAASYRWLRSDNSFSGGQYNITIGSLSYLETFTYSMPAGDVTSLWRGAPFDAVSLRIMADSNSTITESNETNNTWIIPREYPDLVIEQGVLNASNFSVTVHNYGPPFNTPSGYVMLTWQWTDAVHTPLGPSYSVQLADLNLGYNQALTHTATLTELNGLLSGIPAGAQLLHVSVDDAFTVPESAKNNNYVELPKPAIASPTPTLTTTPIPVSPPTPTPIPTPLPTATLLPSYTPKPSLTSTPFPEPTPSETLPPLQPKLSPTPLVTPKATLRPAPTATVLPPQIPKTTVAPTPSPTLSPTPSATPEKSFSPSAVDGRQAAVSAEFSIKESDIRELRVPVKVERGVKLNVRGWDIEKKEEIVSKPDAVQTGEELKTYAEALAVSDENIKKLGVANGGVEIAYAHRGKMLGFIPWGYIVSSSVSKSGGVKVKFPWYSIFLKKDFNTAELAEEVETDLRKLESDAQVLQPQNEMTKLSRTFQLLSNIMKARHDAAQSAIQNLR